MCIHHVFLMQISQCLVSYIASAGWVCAYVEAVLDALEIDFDGNVSPAAGSVLAQVATSDVHH